MTIETELPAVKVSIPAAEEITADWGERCPDFEPGCFCCQMWAMHDEISRLQRENEHFTKSGIIEVAVRNISVSDYMNHWEGRAADAEAKLAEEAKVRALEWKGMAPTAETIVGVYSIGRIGGNWSVGLLRHGNSYEAQIASGEAPLFEIALVEAKAAAQGDYERRIRSALVPSTPAESRCEELVKALEEAREYLKFEREIFDAAQEADHLADVLISIDAALSAYRKASAALKELGKGDGR